MDLSTLRVIEPGQPGRLRVITIAVVLVMSALVGESPLGTDEAAAQTVDPVDPVDAPQVVADPPVVTCSTTPNIFNTGFNGTNGVLANNANDNHWKVSGNFTPVGSNVPAKNGNLGYYFRNPSTQPEPNTTGLPLGGTLPPDRAVYPFGPPGSPEFAGSTGDPGNPGAGLPAAASAFTPAKVGNVGNVWPATPTGTSGVSNWISPLFAQNQSDPGNQGGFPLQAGIGSDRGDWFFLYQFTLDPSVPPAAFQLSMNWLADNNLASVWVNGVQQSGTNLPQPSRPRGTGGGDGTAYTSQGYNAVGSNPQGPARTDMTGDWKRGLNTIVVQVKSTANYMGFRAQVVANVPLCPPVSLALVKRAVCGVPAGPCAAVNGPGETITYEFVVTNTGQANATNLTVIDTRAPPSSSLPAPVCPVTTLAPGAFTTCTSTYTVTEADAAVGEVVNAATADATAPAGRVTSNLYSAAVDVLGTQPGWTAIVRNTDNSLTLVP